MKKIAFYGGTFDPIHVGHLTIARKLIEFFALDEFWLVPAFHAPHKLNKKTSSAFHRHAMLCLATQNDERIKVSTIELDAPERPYTIETLTKLKTHHADSARIFFVMGADSWNEIETWREWEKLLLLTSFIIVTRPQNEISTSHVTRQIKELIVDLRLQNKFSDEPEKDGIYITDAVQISVSATEIRRKVFANETDWRTMVSPPVKDYIEKHRLYLRND